MRMSLKARLVPYLPENRQHIICISGIVNLGSEAKWDVIQRSLVVSELHKGLGSTEHGF